jgi:hypothetical protein
MASVLREWLSSSLHLSRDVSSLERDLSNGVVLAEVLVALDLAPQDLLGQLVDKSSVRLLRAPSIAVRCALCALKM